MAAWANYPPCEETLTNANNFWQILGSELK